MNLSGINLILAYLVVVATAVLVLTILQPGGPI